MSLLAKIQSTLDGMEDRAGITAFDIYVSVSQKEKQENEKISDIHEFLNSDKLNDPSFWYFIDLALDRWHIRDANLHKEVRILLDNLTRLSNHRARFYALRSLAKLEGQLLPKEIDKEEILKSKAPALWLDLMLEAYAGGNADYITSEIVKLIQGTSPPLGWKELREKLSEIRQAFDSTATFRSKMKIVASNMNDPTEGQKLLEAVDRRVGGRLAQRNNKDTNRSGCIVYKFPKRLFIREKEDSQKFVSPQGMLEEMA